MRDVAILRRAVARALPTAAAIRHDIHRNPETANEEHRTSALVRERLEQIGVAAHPVAGTGVRGVIRGARPGGTIALRADMDALPMQETSGVPHASEVPGKMHACGHDGHTACLLGAAEALAGMREALAGTVKLLFQPAEEGGGGAARMIDGGVLTDPTVDMILALHAWPELDAGEIGLRAGPVLASTDGFRVTIQGRSGHGAHPDQCVDPILVAARVVEAIQGIVSRELDPLEPAVVTVGGIHGGTASNIIPDTVTLRGTVRTLSPATRAQAREAFLRIVRGVAEAHRATADIGYSEGLPVTVNDERAVALLRSVGEDLLGRDAVTEMRRPSLGGEDFSLYLARVPGAIFRLGTGPGRPALHSSGFDFNDDALETGILMLAGAALKFLASGPE
ncbi:MAG: amidohydrolase [Armatimonadetes bacterium]|nr:amidohydrolase [Armatimonadota bacterium]